MVSICLFYSQIGSGHTRSSADRGRQFKKLGSRRKVAKNAGQVVVVELELIVTVSNRVGVLTVPVDSTVIPVSAAAEPEDVEDASGSVVDEGSTGIASAEPDMRRTRKIIDRIVNLALNE